MSVPIITFPSKPDFYIKEGDTAPNLVFSLVNQDGTIPVVSGTAATVTFNMMPDGSADGTTPTVSSAAVIITDPTFTATFGTSTFTANAHGFPNGLGVNLSNSGGALPSGLNAWTKYYVLNPTTNTFQLALAPNGNPVTFTDNGSGTNTVIASRVKYVWATNDTAKYGNYWGEFKVTFAGGAVERYPNGPVGHEMIFIQVDQKAG